MGQGVGQRKTSKKDGQRGRHEKNEQDSEGGKVVEFLDEDPVQDTRKGPHQSQTTGHARRPTFVAPPGASRPRRLAAWLTP